LSAHCHIATPFRNIEKFGSLERKQRKACINLPRDAHRADGVSTADLGMLAAESARISSRLEPSEHAPALLLLDADLWGKFHEHQNEMILTKSGRCLFPCLRFKAVNLDPDASYMIRLDFEKIDSRRFRFYDGNWSVSSSKRLDDDSGDQSILSSNPPSESYTHPDLYQTGKFWTRGPISFANVKLSNAIPDVETSLAKTGSRDDDPRRSNHLFHMVSFARYRPRVHLVQRSGQSHRITFSATYTFDRTAFIAVTHYQNHRVNDLKKAYNPHAKGFRDTIGTLSLPSPLKRQRPYLPSPEPSEEHKPKKIRLSSSVSGGGESSVRDRELFESDGQWLSTNKCVSGEVRQCGEKSTMVTLSLRNVVPIDNTSKFSSNHRSANGSLEYKPYAPKTLDWKAQVGAASNTQKPSAFDTPDYYHSRQDGQTCASPTLRSTVDRPLVSVTGLHRFQLIKVDPMPWRSNTYIDTSPASLVHITDPVPLSPSSYSHPNPDLGLPLTFVNQVDTGAVSLAGASSTFKSPKPAAVSWYQQFLVSNQPSCSLTVPKNEQGLNSTARSTTLQLSLDLAVEHYEDGSHDKAPIHTPQQHQQDQSPSRPEAKPVDPLTGSHRPPQPTPVSLNLTKSPERTIISKLLCASDIVRDR
jgi:hypothetical protein